MKPAALTTPTQLSPASASKAELAQLKARIHDLEARIERLETGIERPKVAREKRQSRSDDDEPRRER
jgi:cell division protein FtsB